MDALSGLGSEAVEISKPRPAAHGSNPADVAKSFESMMLSQALAAMFEGVPTDGAFGGGFAEETYRGMMLDAVAEQIASSGKFGIAGHVQAQIESYARAREA